MTFYTKEYVSSVKNFRDPFSLSHFKVSLFPKRKKTIEQLPFLLFSHFYKKILLQMNNT